MIGDRESGKPPVLGVRSVGLALAGHIVVFLLLYSFALLHLRPKEAVIPIDLTVVVNENLDGEENEPPPLSNDRPEPPKPPEPKPPEAPPAAEEKIEAVEQIAEKKPEPPKPPEKTKEQLREERIKRMRESAKLIDRPVKIEIKNKPSGNGRTERQTRTEAEIRRFLDQDYRPGTKTQLAADETQRCISLIRAAFYNKWDRPPWTDSLKEMLLSVQFDMSGRVKGYRLLKSSGDAKADATVRQAAALVHMVTGLSTDFLRENPEVTIRFKVTPQ